MLVKNPYRHYPLFIARVVYTDGSAIVRRGNAESEMLYFPGEEEDVLVITMTVQDAAHRPVIETMWVDDKWQNYNEEVVNQIERDAQEPLTCAPVAGVDYEFDPDPVPENEEDYWPADGNVETCIEPTQEWKVPRDE